MTIMHIIFIVSLVSVSLYFLVTLKIWYGWKNIPVNSELSDTYNVKISVIIASRNEDHTLPALLKDLVDQTYSNNMYDIILVDDHSKNKVSNLSLIKKNKPENLVIFELPENQSGKKSALIYGAQKSKSELLLFTDADCRLQPDWINSYATKYIKEKPGLIIGLVDYFFENTVLKIFYRFDFISLVVSGAGTTALGRPTLCNGANLAVKRELYLNMADRLHTNTPSGDDVFLLHEIKKSGHETISIIKSKYSVVKTRPPDSLPEFFNQRIRWASKSKYYSDTDTILLALLVFITNIIIACVIFIYFLNPYKTWYFLLILLLKMIADGFIITSGLNYFGERKQLWLLPLFELIYPIYIIASVTGGVFNAFTWKSDRKNTV